VAPHPAAALVLLAIPGFGNGILDVAGLTLMQRITPERLLGRVFGTLEAVVFGGVALGSVVAAALISWAGIRGAMIAVGALLPAITALTFRRLRDIDRRAEVPERELNLLRNVPLFAPLPAITLDRLAKRAERIDAPAGSRLIHQGDAGDRFYVVGEGTVRVTADGRRRAEIGPGGYFGEIALLRKVPRTADVRALSDVTVYALDSSDFVAAVTGDALSLQAADAVTEARLRVPPTRRRTKGRGASARPHALDVARVRARQRSSRARRAPRSASRAR
jgi:CRP-like cAMP-binding protein